MPTFPNGTRVYVSELGVYGETALKEYGETIEKADPEDSDKKYTISVCKCRYEQQCWAFRTGDCVRCCSAL